MYLYIKNYLLGAFVCIASAAAGGVEAPAPFYGRSREVLTASQTAQYLNKEFKELLTQVQKGSLSGRIKIWFLQKNTQLDKTQWRFQMGFVKTAMGDRGLKVVLKAIRVLKYLWHQAHYSQQDLLELEAEMTLIKALSHFEDRVKLEAIRTLGDIQSQNAVIHLFKFLQSSRFQLEAVFALENINYLPLHVQMELSMMARTHNDMVVQKAALAALSRIKNLDPDILKTAVNILMTGHAPQMRAHTAEFLSRLPPNDFTETRLLKSARMDSSAFVRQACVLALLNMDIQNKQIKKELAQLVLTWEHDPKIKEAALKIQAARIPPAGHKENLKPDPSDSSSLSGQNCKGVF